jgi:hypothetical protein
VDITRRFSSLRQSLQDFHQPLHGLIRRLKEFLQPPKDAHQPSVGFHQSLLGFIQPFIGFHQSPREAWQWLKDANQPSFTSFLPKTVNSPSPHPSPIRWERVAEGRVRVFHFNHQLSTNR